MNFLSRLVVERFLGSHLLLNQTPVDLFLVSSQGQKRVLICNMVHEPIGLNIV